MTMLQELVRDKGQVAARFQIAAALRVNFESYQSGLTSSLLQETLRLPFLHRRWFFGW